MWSSRYLVSSRHWLAEQESRLRSVVSCQCRNSLEVARDPRHLGAEIGFFSVLHTWNQKLGLHPHVHCVIPAGGLSLDHTQWIRSRDRFFFPSRCSVAFFVASFLLFSGKHFRKADSTFMEIWLSRQAKIFAAWLRPLFRKDWVVYAKPRSAAHSMCSSISAATPIAWPSPTIAWCPLWMAKLLFRWRDSAHHNEQKFLPLPVDEFLRRFLLHVLPKGFVRIRNFGFFANRRRATRLPLCFHLLGSPPDPQPTRRIYHQ